MSVNDAPQSTLAADLGNELVSGVARRIAADDLVLEPHRVGNAFKVPFENTFGLRPDLVFHRDAWHEGIDKVASERVGGTRESGQARTSRTFRRLELGDGHLRDAHACGQLSC